MLKGKNYKWLEDNKEDEELINKRKNIEMENFRNVEVQDAKPL